MNTPVTALLLGALTLGAPSYAHAQPTPGAVAPESLSLQHAELLFKERNRDLKAARRMTEGAEADVLTARARPNPTLNFGTTGISPSQGLGAGSPIRKRVDTTVGLAQLIERGGKRDLRTQAAEYQVAAARSDEADVERQQRGLVQAAYYDLLLAQERIRVIEETAQLFGRTVEAANRRLAAGDIAPAEVARISVDALRAQNDAQLARTDRERARLALAYLLGLDDAAPRLVAADGWPAPEPVTALRESDDRLARRADVQAARSRMEAAERGRALARALRTRDVLAGVQFERYPGDVAANNSYGVMVAIPLFTNHTYQGEIRRAEIEYDAAVEHFERVKALATADVRRAGAELAAAGERVRRFRETLNAAAERAAGGAEFAYARGATSVMDVLDARRQLYATRLDHLTAQADHARALAAWRAATAAH